MKEGINHQQSATSEFVPGLLIADCCSLVACAFLATIALCSCGYHSLALSASSGGPLACPERFRRRATSSRFLIAFRRSLIACATLVAFSLSSCGYHVAGRTSELPKSIHVIAVPAMENKTSTFKVEQKLTSATIHEFLAKTTYKITSDPNGGDAVLNAKVLSVEVLPLLFQSTTTTNKPSQSPQANAQTPPAQLAQATAMTITMRCEVTLTERDTDKVLYHTDNFVFRNQYQLASTGVDPATGQPITPTKAQVESFFQEGDPALDRMARDFASRLVSAVVENF